MRMRSGVRVVVVGAMLVALFHPGPPATAQDAPPPVVEPVVDKARFELLDPGQPPLTAEGVGAYRGAIEAVPTGGGLTVVNDVAIEDYVKGIVEVPSAFPAEAQKAQAIAARTFALNAMLRPSPAPWGAVAHICPTDSCQVYWGLRGEQRAGGENWIAAVNATAGQVLLAGGQPIFAQYSASNGGRSAAGSQPYLRAVDDPDDAKSRFGRWRFSIPLGSLAPVLGVQPPDTLTSVSRQGGAVVFVVQSPAPPPTTAPTTTTPLGLLPGPAPAPPEAPPATRQLSLPVGDFVSRANSALPAQAGLPRALPGSNFTMGTEGGSVVVEGGGWGHGIGMSQYGALGKANRGMSAADILATYYGGIRPTRMDPAQMPATIRVAVAPDSGGLTVSSPGLYRIVDGKGNAVVPVATGGWRATPTGGGVRLTPPADQRGPVVLDAVTVDPASPDVGAPPTVRFAVSAPAVMAVRIAPPGAPARDLPPQIVNSGPVSLPVPPGTADGDYHLFLVAEAGPGRQAGVPVRFVVGDPAETSTAAVTPTGAVVIPRPEGDDVGAAVVVVALALLFADLVLMVKASRRRQRPGDRPVPESA